MMDFFTEDKLQQLIPRNHDVHGWYEVLVAELPKYNINTPKRVAGFIAQTAHESLGYKVLQENLNYSKRGLETVFGKYFGPGKRNAANYARNPEKIANVVYANKLGNGNTKSGDGWNYRGRGIIQLTGKSNYEEFGKTVGMTPEQVVDYVQTKKGAVDAACWYWDSRNLNKYCDAEDIIGMTKRINGGTNGLKHRTELWNRGLELFGGKSTQKSTPTTTNFYRTITTGDHGDDVKLVQSKLGITADGSYGPMTKRAVRQFQKAHGLTPDGVVGPNTAKALGI